MWDPKKCEALRRARNKAACDLARKLATIDWPNKTLPASMSSNMAALVQGFKDATHEEADYAQEM